MAPDTTGLGVGTVGVAWRKRERERERSNFKHDRCILEIEHNLWIVSKNTEESSACKGVAKKRNSLGYPIIKIH